MFLSTGVFELVCQNQTVKAREGDNVSLQSYVRPPMNLLDEGVDISKPNSTLSVHSYRRGKHESDQQEKQYRNRTSLSDDDLRKGNMNLRITNVTPADSGQFWFCVPDVGASCCSVNLTVGEFNRPR